MKASPGKVFFYLWAFLTLVLVFCLEESPPFWGVLAWLQAGFLVGQLLNIVANYRRKPKA